MTDYLPQISRIRQKLQQANQADPQRKVFGASSHQYTLSPPATEAEIQAFEQKYGIVLPAPYRIFLLEIGNGGNSYHNSGAGPFYGIFPFQGEEDTFLYEYTAQYLKQPPVIYPGITEAVWDELSYKIHHDDSLSDAEYDAIQCQLYAGILPIGSQGCTYFHAILVSGPHAGKVVNVDHEMNRPRITFEDHFLDWYERWLDEVISGELIDDGPSWFGYSMGGTAESLWEVYQNPSDTQTKEDALNGLFKKKEIPQAILVDLEQEYMRQPAHSKLILQLLTQSDYPRAKPHLITYLQTDFLTPLQFVFRYAKHDCAFWANIIRQHPDKLAHRETLQYASYILDTQKEDYAELLIPQLDSPDPLLRAQAILSLGNQPDKTQYTAYFIQLLSDPDPNVIRHAFHGLKELKNPDLLRHYKAILDRFPTEEGYLLSNLSYLLQEFNIKEQELRDLSASQLEKRIAKLKKYYR